MRNYLYVNDDGSVGYISETDLFKQFVGDLFPVGFILISTDPNFDPNVVYGGTWLLLPNGKYFKSCDNVLTVPGVYFAASFPPVYGSGTWERNGRFATDTYIVDGGFKIVGNFPVVGPSSQSGTSCPVIAFDAGWNTNYPNNPYRVHDTMGEDGTADVDHYTVMAWEKQQDSVAKSIKVNSILDSWEKELEILQSGHFKFKDEVIAKFVKKIEAFKKTSGCFD